MAPAPQSTVPARVDTISPQPAAPRDSDRAPAAAPNVKADTTNVSSAEVKKTALQVFGDSAAPVPVAADSLAEDAPGLDVRPYETQERVAYYVRMFSGTARERIENRLEQGSRYEPMMRAKLHAAGLPEDLVYLALIESGYNPDAYSKAAAVGMWQLMTGTAQGSGLRVDWWVDERRDPVRSTDAAIRFLRYLNDQFGSLYLAAAAYNGGPGRVARGLERYADDLQGTTGEDRFFALAEKDYLRAETRNYVPQLIAAALIAKEPQRYGMTLRTLPPFVYDTVVVPASTPMAAVAHAAGVPVSHIVELNPQVLRGVTPPKTSFTVRVPVGAAATFDSSFAALPAAERTAYTRVISKKGDTRVTLARKAHISSTQLGWYNPRLEVAKKSGRVVAGQVVLIPSEAVVAAAREVPDPSIEIYGSSKAAVYHTVKSGETLGGIAKRYKTTTQTVMRLNGLRKSIIIPGQRLVVKGGSGRSSKAHTRPAKKGSKRNASR
ncbi:MAG: transglycosylase SLT domain-containing protein [Gemmatimonadaceae bacterium]